MRPDADHPHRQRTECRLDPTCESHNRVRPSGVVRHHDRATDELISERHTVNLRTCWTTAFALKETEQPDCRWHKTRRPQPGSRVCPQLLLRVEQHSSSSVGQRPVQRHCGIRQRDLSRFSLTWHFLVMSDYSLNRSDAELLVAARADSEAFGEFFRRNAIGMERWLRTQTPDLATAADLTAETFAQALVSLDRFRGTSDEQAVAWLFGIARNLVRRFHRRGRAELAVCRRLGIELVHDEEELAHLEAQVDASAQASELSHALNTCPTLNDKPYSCG